MKTDGIEINMLGDINQTQKDSYYMFLSYAVSILQKQSRDKTKQKD